MIYVGLLLRPSMKLIAFFFLLTITAWADEAVPLNNLAPRPPNPTPSEQPKDGLNPLLSQKRLPKGGAKSKKPNVRAIGGATNGSGAGGLSTKVGEF